MALTPEWSNFSGFPVAPAHQAQCCGGMDLGRATPMGLSDDLSALPMHSRCQLWGQEAKAPRTTLFIS